MKSRGLILVVVLLAGLLGVYFLSGNMQRQSPKAVVGLDAPSFELKDTEGRTWKLSDLKGKVVLLNLWASWCDPCKEELPSIQKLLNREKGNDKLVFISVLYKDDPAKALSYLKEHGFAFPVLIDTANVAGSYGITGVPETFVIDKKGILKQRVVGPMPWDSPDVQTVLNQLENQ